VADRISKYFVPIVILLALIAWIIWFSYAYSAPGYKNIDLMGSSRFQFAFNFGISTLVIACPCALGLATPTAVMVGTGVAASLGILIKGGDVLEKISSITTIVFDKTGTLTSGAPLVQDFISVKDLFKVENASDDKDFLLFIAYLAEKQSEHPLAKAIVKKLESLIPSKIEEMSSHFEVVEFRNREGEGFQAKIKNQEGEELLVNCGNDRLMRNCNIKIEVLSFY